LIGHTRNIKFKIIADHKILYDIYSNKIGMNKNEEINILDKDVDSDDDKGNLNTTVYNVDDLLD
jgi:hypothetical protein